MNVVKSDDGSSKGSLPNVADDVRDNVQTEASAEGDDYAQSKAQGSYVTNLGRQKHKVVTSPT